MTVPTAEPLRSAYQAALDCVHCGLCLEACPTYRELGLETDSPRGRIYLMRGLAEGRIADPEAVRTHLDRCLGCRACESACPAGVRYGEILESVRGEMQRARERTPWSARVRGVLLWQLLARQGRLRWAFRLGRLAEATGLRRLAGWLRLLPRSRARLLPPVPDARARRPLPPTSPATAPVRGEVALLTGCVMEQMFGAVNRATRDLLVANGFTTHAPTAQRCCGALLLHDGHVERARQLAAANVRAFAGCEVVVVNSAGCGAALKEYGHLLGTPEAKAFAAKVRDVCEFLDEVGLRAEPAPFPHRVAYDDPCHLCHAQGVRAAPRRLLQRVPGLQAVAHDDPEDCCGSAGIYNLVHVELAAAVGARKASSLLRSGAEVVATGNPGCMLQIAAALRDAGSAVRVVHPVELLLPPEAG